MTIAVSWDNEERTVVRLEFPAEWTWAMFGDAMKSVAGARSSAPGELHLILDLGRTSRMPEGAPFHLRNALGAAPVGYVVVTGTSPSVHNAIAFLEDIDPELGARVIPVRSVDAARAVLSHPYSLQTPVSPANVER